MKKQIGLWIGLFLFLMTCSSVTVLAADSFVYDEYGVLSEMQYQTLNEEISSLNREYPLEAVIVISENLNMDDRQYAAQFMQYENIGYGPEYDGVCLLHQPGNRGIAIVFRGSLQYAFGQSVQDMILDDCIEYLRENDFMGAYEVVIRDVRNCMKRVASGKSIRPMDIRGESIFSFAGIAFLISLGTMAIPTFLMILFQRSKMNMIYPQPNADSYIPENGFILSRKSDRFLRTNVIRSAKPKDEGKHGGGSSGSFSSGGESFSGSSRKY